MVTEIVLPWPPSVNHMYAAGRGGAKRLTPKARAFRELAVSLIYELGLPTVEGPVELWLDLYPPDNRARDIDNPEKALLDALQHGKAIANDRQIRIKHTELHGPTPGGRAVVRIREI